MKWMHVFGTRWERRAAALAVAAMLGIGLQAQTPVQGNLQTGVTRQLQQLQATVQMLQPEHWKAPGSEKADLRDAQQSIERNLQEAVPPLLAAWNREPRNLSSAFRLYRDLDALYQVSLRLSAAAQTYARNDGGPQVQASIEGLHQSLLQLGDYIQATAGLQYQALEQVAQARRSAPPPPPKTLVIQDANGGAPAHRRHPPAHPKKKTPPPHH